MNRIHEDISIIAASAPASLAASTDLSSGYISGAGRQSIDFVIQFSALAKNKTLTVSVYQANDSTGADAEKITESVFTASEALTNGRVIASVRVKGNGGGWYGVKVQHDNSAAVHCSILALCRENYIPLDAGWVLQA